MVFPSIVRICASASGTSTFPGDPRNASYSRLNHARTFSTKTGNPTWNGKSDWSKSNVSITHFGFSEATIRGVCFEAAITVKFAGSMRAARSMETSWTETYCMTGWFSDHVVISGFRTSPVAGLNQEAAGAPMVRAGRSGGGDGAHRVKRAGAI